MVVHVQPPHLTKRQDPLAPPTDVAGITNIAVTIDQSSVTATNLAFDTSATPGTGTAPLLGLTFTPVVTTHQSDITSTPTPSPTPATVTTSGAAKPIAMSTVIGTCVGAFIGAAALIILGLWFYRRYSRSLKQQAMSRGRRIQGRNLHRDVERRRSRLEPWDKLDGDDDKWEDMYQTKEVDQVAPMEKLTMFKKTPSVRTAFTHNPDDPPLDFPQSFAPFNPNFAQTLSAEKATMSEPRPFLGRVGASSVNSWDSETAAKDSYLSVRSRMSGGAVSPTLNMAIPTPQAIFSQPHKWESAEVVHYSGGQSAEILNPFDSGHDEDNRKSTHNPFFGAQEYTSQPRSRSNSVAKSPSSKGKERMRYSTDPFEAANMPPPPKPRIINHEANDSTTSIESRHRALQSLMAALEISEAEVHDRLRVASMQPSIMSQASQYTADGNEDVTSAFPLPPSLEGSS